MHILISGHGSFIYRCHISGDPTPADLRHRRVKIIPWDICNSRWAPTEEGRELPRDVICTGSEVPHSPSCFVSTLRKLGHAIYMYRDFFQKQTLKFSLEFFCYFSYFCSKHRLWVHVRIVSPRRFKRVPTVYVLEQK